MCVYVSCMESETFAGRGTFHSKEGWQWQKGTFNRKLSHRKASTTRSQAAVADENGIGMRCDVPRVRYERERGEAEKTFNRNAYEYVIKTISPKHLRNSCSYSLSLSAVCFSPLRINYGTLSHPA